MKILIMLVWFMLMHVRMPIKQVKLSKHQLRLLIISLLRTMRLMPLTTQNRILSKLPERLGTVCDIQIHRLDKICKNIEPNVQTPMDILETVKDINNF